MLRRSILPNIIIIVICLFVTRVAYYYVFKTISSYLPDISLLQKYNVGNFSINPPLDTFRNQYIYAFKDSLTISIVVGLLCFVILQYIYWLITYQGRISAIKTTYEALGRMKEQNKNQFNELTESFKEKGLIK